MAYIEREAAINAVFEAYADGRSAYIALEAIPAADVVLVRHGRWDMLSYDEAVCTCCGYDRNTLFESTKEAKERWDELPPFCEMCGARMDGSEEVR